jgi:hypothetical protein
MLIEVKLTANIYNHYIRFPAQLELFCPKTHSSCAQLPAVVGGAYILTLVPFFRSICTVLSQSHSGCALLPNLAWGGFEDTRSLLSFPPDFSGSVPKATQVELHCHLLRDRLCRRHSDSSRSLSPVQLNLSCFVPETTQVSLNPTSVYRTRRGAGRKAGASSYMRKHLSLISIHRRCES